LVFIKNLIKKKRKLKNFLLKKKKKVYIYIYTSVIFQIPI